MFGPLTMGGEHAVLITRGSETIEFQGIIESDASPAPGGDIILIRSLNRLR
jgi:hypothetical protein